jgi:hypothetical protein
MSPDAKAAKARGFSRYGLPDPEKIMLVKSVCQYCGLEIVGSVSHGLPEQEQEHADTCKKRPPTSASSPSSSHPSSA